METSQSSTALRIKVGVFALMGLLVIGAVTVFVNNRPFWWRSCQLVHINIEDASGLQAKSAIRSLGLQIGYLQSIELYETFVKLGICVTAPVEVLPSTRAYIRGEGFLGDKFVELKPVKYVGEREEDDATSGAPSAPKSAPVVPPATTTAPGASIKVEVSKPLALLLRSFEALFSAAHAQGASSQKSGREIPVGQSGQDVTKLVEQVDGLVSEMKGLTNNLREAINPQDLRRTMLQLNKTLENASKTLSPAGGLNTTAQRTLEKLEDSIDQLRDVMTRINKGEGSIGMLVNDPVYAQELRETIRSLNSVINRLSRVRIALDIFVEQLSVRHGTRAALLLNIWPTPVRYYRLGMTSDSRGSLGVNETTTVSGGVSTTVKTTSQDVGALVMTAQMGRVFFRRLDLAVGLLHGDGVISTGIYFGPTDRETLLTAHAEVYGRLQGVPLDSRIYGKFQPLIGKPVWGSVYFRGGLESIRKTGGQYNITVGAGLAFDDEDLRVLFAFR